jgi:nickel/cobalt exporter
MPAPARNARECPRSSGLAGPRGQLSGDVIRQLPFLALWMGLATAGAVAAHPADEANVYHYLWIEARPREITLQHAVVVGGLLTPTVWQQIDRNRDGARTPAEAAAHAGETTASLGLRVNGRPARWTLREHAYPQKAEFFGSSTAHLTLRLTAPLPRVGRSGARVAIRDDTFPFFTGVFPQPVVKSDGVAVESVSVSENGRLVEFRLVPGAGTGITGRAREAIRSDAAPSPASGREPDPRPEDLFPERGKVLYASPGDHGHEPGLHPGGHGHGEGPDLKDLLHRPLTPLLIVLALGASLLAGMAHALTPGHGKTMVAAYLVGTRGTVKDAVLLGIVVTITHTAGIYLLGFLCLWLTSRIRAEVVGQWLSLTSGLLVLGMGFWLFQRGLLHYHGVRALPGHAHGPGGHGHSHGHAHDQPHDHDDGATPGHSHEGPPGDAPASVAATESETRRGVIALGVAGGIVPCFDALAVLIAAVNLGRIELGLALIAAFSVGMALVLVAIGVLMVKAKSTMARFTGEGPLVRALPAVSGGILFLLGAWLTFQSLVAVGVLRVG